MCALVRRRKGRGDLYAPRTPPPLKGGGEGRMEPNAPDPAAPLAAECLRWP